MSNIFISPSFIKLKQQLKSGQSAVWKLTEPQCTGYLQTNQSDIVFIYSWQQMKNDKRLYPF